jgi:hypothetical protein
LSATIGRIAATILLVIVVATVAGPGGAAAESDHGAAVLTVGFPEAIPVTFSGDLVVRFHGDPGTDCAARGLCGYTGTVQWTPTPGWQLQVNKGLFGPAYSLALQNSGFGIAFQAPAGGTTDDQTHQQSARQGSPGASCDDAMRTGGQVGLPIVRGQVAIWLRNAYPSIVQTRCPGPLISDLASALPLAWAPLRTILRGDDTIGLRGDHSFAANGLAGTVNSTLMLRLGEPSRDGSTSTLPLHEHRERSVTAHDGVAITGATTDDISGDRTRALCGPLAACGVHGAVSVRPGVGGAKASFEADGPVHLPYRDFLAALNLTDRGPAPKSIGVDETISWRHGVTIADLSQGASSCTDSAQLGRGQMDAFVRAGRLHAQYVLGDDALGDMFRTRCAGPFGPQFSVITGTVPLSDLTTRRFVLSLDGRPKAIDDGYTEHISSRLTLTFTRVSVTSRIIRFKAS